MAIDSSDARQQIRDSIGKLQVQLTDPNFQDPNRSLLEDALSSLMDQQNALDIGDMRAMVNKLQGCNNDLQDLVTQMKKASAKISAFADTINKVISVVNILAQAATKAISA